MDLSLYSKTMSNFIFKIKYHIKSSLYSFIVLTRSKLNLRILIPLVNTEIDIKLLLIRK